MEFLERAYSFNFEGIGEDGVYKFRFISTGKQDITKVISISPIEAVDNWYNLGFGNLEEKDGKSIVNDASEKNNNDYDKVLATVFMTALYLFTLRPNAVIVFFGNTVHKHRIYKQKISANLESLTEDLKISGGFTNVTVDIVETEQTVIRKGKERTRVIKEKDMNSISKDIVVKRIEDYERENSKTYQFVLIELKNNPIIKK